MLPGTVAAETGSPMPSVIALAILLGMIWLAYAKLTTNRRRERRQVNAAAALADEATRLSPAVTRVAADMETAASRAGYGWRAADGWREAASLVQGLSDAERVTGCIRATVSIACTGNPDVHVGPTIIWITPKRMVLADTPLANNSALLWFSQTIEVQSEGYTLRVSDQNERTVSLQMGTILTVGYGMNETRVHDMGALDAVRNAESLLRRHL